MTQWQRRLQITRGCLVALVVLICLFLWVSLVSFNPQDHPSPHVWPHPEPAENAAGKAGAWTAYHVFLYFGKGAYAAVIGLTIALWVLLRQGRLPNLWQRVLGISLLVSVTSCATHVWTRNNPNAWLETRGGVLGYLLADWLLTNVKWLTLPILAYLALVGLLFTAEGAVMRVPEMIRRRKEQLLELTENAGPAKARVAQWFGPIRRLTAAFERLRPQLAGATAESGSGARGRSLDSKSAPASKPRIRPSNEDEKRSAAAPAIDQPLNTQPTAAPQQDDSDESPDESATVETVPAVAEANEPLDASEIDDDDAHDEPLAPEPKMVVKFSAPPKIPTAAAIPQRPYPAELEAWEFPPIAMLSEPEYHYSAQQEALVREKAKVLEQALQEYRIEAKVVEIDTGPVITMYEVHLAPGIKVSQINSLANDIARAMKAPSVRVVAPLPGKNTIGIEVPNINKEKVRLKELMTLSGNGLQKMQVPLFLGKNASGEPLIGDLTAMPHMLIAGTTGSGKSVCINSIIMSVLMTQRPDMVKLILVDPKMVEMSQFREVPHLMCPIVTETDRAEKILEWATVKMDERYALLAEAGVRNIAAFNRMSKEEKYERFQPTTDEERAQIPGHLPYVVIIIDELADLMMTSAKEVELHLSRLAQKSRAVGIHIIVATQRPEAKIVTGLIKSNLPCRVAFRVASRMDSRIVLDQNGAEVLMGQGDMLYLPPGSSKLVRAQGTYLEDQELKEVINYLRDKGQPEFHPELMQLGKQSLSGDEPRDELFEQAVEIVLQSRRGSVSLLQRRLTIGYSRASRLVDEMAAAGIVGEYKGSQAREVLMTMDEWQELKVQEAARLREKVINDPVPDMLHDDDI